MNTRISIILLCVIVLHSAGPQRATAQVPPRLDVVEDEQLRFIAAHYFDLCYGILTKKNNETETAIYHETKKALLRTLFQYWFATRVKDSPDPVAPVVEKWAVIFATTLPKLMSDVDPLNIKSYYKNGALDSEVETMQDYGLDWNAVAAWEKYQILVGKFRSEFMRK